MTELISGINNSVEWYNSMGLEILRSRGPWQPHLQSQIYEIEPPSRYRRLFEAAYENHEFWDYIRSCNHMLNVEVSLHILTQLAIDWTYSLQ